MQESQSKPKHKQTKDKNDRNFLYYGTMGMQMLVTIAIFAFGGHWLDVQLGFKFPIFTLVLSLTGVFAALYFAIKKL